MKYLLLLLLQFSVLVVSAKTEQVYIDLGEEAIEIGTYEGNLSAKRNKKSFDYSAESFQKIIQEVKGESGEKVMLYFHSLYGGVDVYHKNTIKKFKSLQGVDKIISVVWHTKGLSYLDSYEQAITTGRDTKALILGLLANQSTENIVLCHSMGHRIFEGVIENEKMELYNLNLVLLTGSDLDADVFKYNFQNLTENCDRIVLYVHEKDRLLQFSKKRHQEFRLGLNGLEESKEEASLDHLEIVNVTNSGGKRLIRLSNHIYFKRDPKVLRDISYVINGEEEKRKSYLVGSHKHSYRME